MVQFSTIRGDLLRDAGLCETLEIDLLDPDFFGDIANSIINDKGWKMYPLPLHVHKWFSVAIKKEVLVYRKPHKMIDTFNSKSDASLE